MKRKVILPGSILDMEFLKIISDFEAMDWPEAKA